MEDSMTSTKNLTTCHGYLKTNTSSWPWSYNWKLQIPTQHIFVGFRLWVGVKYIPRTRMSYKHMHVICEMQLTIVLNSICRVPKDNFHVRLNKVSTNGNKTHDVFHSKTSDMINLDFEHNYIWQQQIRSGHA